MNLFGFNIQVSRAKTVTAAAPVQRFFDPQAWLAGEDIDSGPALSNAYEQVVWVYRAINVLAEQIANVPFVFSAGERGRENLITSGPLLDFYNRPHPQLNRFQYWELRVIWLMLRGECFRVPIYEDDSGRLSLAAAGRSINPTIQQPTNPSIHLSTHPAVSGRRRLKRVLILDPARFQHIVEDHRLIGWRYTGFGPRAPLASQVFLPEEVWFEKLPNPFDFWRGFPPLFVAEMATRTDFAAGLFMRGIIENNADTGLIVRTDKWLSDEQREQIRTALKERKRHAGCADRPVLLLGSAEVIKPQLSSSDLQFLDNRKFSRAEICAAFGVPEEIVTSTEHAKYDVMAGARLNFIENRVAPLCSRLEAEEDVTVRSIDPLASGWFDLDSLPILQDARRKRLAAARTGFDMGVPFNELNRVLDLGFKPLPWGDEGFVAGNLQRLSDANNGGDGENGEGNSEARIPKAERRPNPEIRINSTCEAGESVDALAADKSDAVAEGDPFSRAQRLLADAAAYQLSTIDPQLTSKLRRFLFEQRGRVLEKLGQYCGCGAGTTDNKPVAEAAPLTVEEAIERVFDLQKENEELSKRVPDFCSAGQESTASTADPSPSSAAEIPSRRITAGFNERIRAALLESLRAGLSAGEGLPELSTRVKAFYNETTKHHPIKLYE